MIPQPFVERSPLAPGICARRLAVLYPVRRNPRQAPRDEGMACFHASRARTIEGAVYIERRSVMMAVVAAATIVSMFAPRGLAHADVAAPATYTVTDFRDTGAPGQLRTLIRGAALGDTIAIPADTIIKLEGTL